MLYKSGTGIWRPRRRAVPLRGDFAWWDIPGQTCVVAYQPKGAADLASSYVNLANPGTYDCTATNAPSFNAATGWTFTRTSSQSVTTGLTPAAGGSVFVRFSNATLIGNSSILSTTDDHGGYWIAVNWNDGAHHLICTRGKVAAWFGTNTATSGVWGSTPTDAYKDGADVGNMGANYTSTNWDLRIGGSYIIDGTPENFYTGNVLAVVFYSTALTTDDVAVLTTRMNAL